MGTAKVPAKVPARRGSAKKRFQMIKIEPQLRDQIWNQQRTQLGDQLWNQLWNQLVKQLWDQIWGQLRDQLGDQLRAQLLDQLYKIKKRKKENE
jgi:hypothetical protein